MQSKKFEGRSAEMKKPTPWLASEDIMGVCPVTVTVEGCYFHKAVEFDGGRKEDVYGLKFVGKDKRLVMNSTNRRTMVDMFGTNVKDWEDKKIELTVVDCKMMGKDVKGIRIVNRTETK